MPDRTFPNTTPRSNEPGEAVPSGPRWFMLEQPRITGMATFEWNTVTGISWYSEEWEQIVQSPYDWTKPSDQAWWAARVHPEDSVRFQRGLLAVYAGLMETLDLPCRLRRGDGTWRQVLLRCRVTHKTPTGGPWIVSGVVVDLTDVLPDMPVEKTRTALSGDEYHSMLENSPDLFIRFDRNLLPVYVNPSVCRYMGGSRLGRAFSEEKEDRRIAGNCHGLFEHYVSRVFTEHAVVREELSLTMTDGSSVVGDCSFWPEFDETGNVLHCMMQFRDITDKRLAEQRATLNEKRLEALYQLTLMDDAREDEVLSFVMDSVLELTGSHSGFFFIPEKEGSDRGKLLWSGDHYRYLDRRYLVEDHLPRDLIVQMTDADGNRVYRSINNSKGNEPLFMVFGGGMQVMRGIIAPGMEDRHMVCVAGVCNRDSDYDEGDLQQFETFMNNAWLILRRRRHMIELHKAKNEAEEAKKIMAEFLANVNHELRTPLTSILGYAETLIQLDPEEQDARVHFLEVIQRHAGRMHRLVCDLLNLSRVEGGRMPMELESVNLAALARKVSESMREQFEAKRLEVVLDVPPDVAIMADAHFLSQVFRNLLENAARFAFAGTCIEITAAHTDDAVVVGVRDYGQSIAPDEISHIFERFYRGRHNAPDQKSTGIGLSICKLVVERHSGSIWAENSPGGVSVCFSLPV